jgi:hypothetical protein
MMFGMEKINIELIAAGNWQLAAGRFLPREGHIVGPGLRIKIINYR